MKNRLLIAWIGNLIDTASTAILCRGYGFTEVNPVMAWLLHIPALFVAVKLTAMTAVCVLLWHNRDDKKANVASRIAAAVYGAIAIYYIGWSFTIKFY
jgi:hypothetical protein